eukprot:TRINITY_DN8635_c1_g1_i1.p1 TRINITY_DN8635_c1_g1~~TRINITY_DN8635_c1_g1_i1.p1  ORF type:complete len:221 (-),score=21.99 TRINITY_DN8635_c1_g1_i1:190-822(-)
MQNAPITLFSNKEEKEFVEDSANLFSVLKTLQLVETAYSRGVTSDEEYEKVCEQLISQKRALYQGHFKAKIGDLAQFARSWNLIAEKAIYRLEKGMPATRENVVRKNDKGQGQYSLVFALSRKLVEFSDQFEMGLTTVEDVLPTLKNIVNTALQISLLNHEAPELHKMVGWEGTLTNMSASEKLSDEQKHQLCLDLSLMNNWLENTLRQH